MEIFLFFFWKAVKIAGSAQKNSVGWVIGNSGIFFRPYIYDWCIMDKDMYKKNNNFTFKVFQFSAI